MFPSQNFHLFVNCLYSFFVAFNSVCCYCFCLSFQRASNCAHFVLLNIYFIAKVKVFHEFNKTSRLFLAQTNSVGKMNFMKWVLFSVKIYLYNTCNKWTKGKKDHNKALCKWKFESKTSDRLYVRIEKLDCACIVNEMKKEITYIYTEVYEYNIALKFHSKMTMGNGFQSGRRNKISRGKWQSMQMNEFQVKKSRIQYAFDPMATVSGMSVHGVYMCVRAMSATVWFIWWIKVKITVSAIWIDRKSFTSIVRHVCLSFAYVFSFFLLLSLYVDIFCTSRRVLDGYMWFHLWMERFVSVVRLALWWRRLCIVRKIGSTTFGPWQWCI